MSIAPGRINLIGEHTDYNEGWALPMAIDRGVRVVYVPRTDRALRVYSTAHQESRHLELDHLRCLEAGGGAGWWRYVAAVAAALERDGIELPGIDAVIVGDLPMASGLSSSAALELAVAGALCDAAGTEWRPRQMATLCARAENEGVGVACGVMDQMASALGRAGHALLLDCRTLEFETVALPGRAAVVVLDSGVQRTLAGSAFNLRRQACERATLVLGRLDSSVRALRDATLEQLEEVSPGLDAPTRRYARHVIEECDRPRGVVRAFARGDLEGAGELMNASHASLRDLYRVSCPELDAVTARARRHESCFGARLTGAGFGGCAIALVDSAGVEAFVDEMNAAETGAPTVRRGVCHAFRVEAAAGAHILVPDSCP